jgi:putative flippase GtrA
MDMQKSLNAVLEIVKFGLASLTPLAIDLVIFAFFSPSIPSFWANLVSSTVGAVVVYFLASRFVFYRRLEVRKGGLMLAWYCVASLIWSLVIGVLVSNLSLAPLCAKVITVPPSFFVNFLVARFIIRG